MLKQFLKTLFAVAAITAMSSTSSALADSLSGSHPDVAGNSVDFTNISELDVSTEPISELFFGEGTGDGDMLVFAPPQSFVSLSSNGEAKFLDGRLSIDITAKNGGLFNSITIDEGGGYNVSGPSALARATLIGFVVADGEIYSDSTSFEATSGQGDWTLSSSFVFPETDRATLVIDNQLQTQARQGPNTAFIDKKVVKITVAIPEPATAAFLGLGAIGTLIRRRR